MSRRNAVLLVTDENLLPPALHLWNRLRSLNTREDTDILLVLPDAALDRIPQAALSSVIPISCLPMPPISYNGPSHVTEAACLRIVAPRLLREAYARILYLDIDVLVADASVFRVFDVELRTPLAATRWHKKSFDPQAVVDGKVREGTFEFRRYFNSGVLLIDVDRYVSGDIDGKALTFLAEEGARSETPDQTALNVAVGEAWQELSPAMNFRAELLPTFLAQRFPPVVIQSVGEQKSWQSPSVRHPLRSEQLKWLWSQGYWRFLAGHVRARRLIRAIGKGIRGKGAYKPPYINPQNPLMQDYLAVDFVDRWNLRPDPRDASAPSRSKV
jgi:lipopolysaccharide biosynthesis glycosyltransferase